jgi:hypothetical protein
MSEKQIKQQFQSAMQHKYSVGDKVRVVNHKYIDGAEGEISALMPYSFVEPAYYVDINGMVTAVSERSLEKIEKEGRKHDSSRAYDAT